MALQEQKGVSIAAHLQLICTAQGRLSIMLVFISTMGPVRHGKGQEDANCV